MSGFKFFIFLALAVVTAACHSDNSPEAVADRALTALHNADYIELKSLCDPADGALINKLNELISEVQANENDYGRPPRRTIPRTLTSVTDADTDGSVTSATVRARVTFATETAPFSVILVRDNGKWYYSAFD